MEQEDASSTIKHVRVLSYKGRIVGAKLPLRLSHVWSIRTDLEIKEQEARPCPLRLGHRQQAARL